MTEEPEESSSLQPADKGSSGLVRVMDRRVTIATRVLSDIASKRAPGTGIGKTSRRITLEVAERFLCDEKAVNLGHYSEIDDDAAQALAYHKGSLRLDGLRSISPSAASFLCHNQNAWGCGKSDRWSSRTLSLNGLTLIDEDVTFALSSFKGYLSLNGLTEISERSMINLASGKLGLSLNGIGSISDSLAESLYEAANINSCYDRIIGRISFSGIHEISKYAAGALTYFDADLLLNGITHLNEEAAVVLAHNDGDIFLDGISEICDATASALSFHGGIQSARRHHTHLGLSLAGVRRLTKPASKSLANYQGFWLVLDGLKNFDHFHCGEFENFEGRLSLNGITEINNRQSDNLSKLLCASVSLNGIKNIDSENLIKLAEIHGRIELGCTDPIDDFTANRIMQSNCSSIGFPEIKVLSESMARMLVSKTRSYLELNKVRALTETAATALSALRGRLGLDGLTSLSDAAALALSAHDGSLQLNGLTSLSDDAALALSAHSGPLGLSGLTSLSDIAAKALSKHNGALFLSGLSSLSETMAVALSAHSGCLQLNGLRSLSDAAAKALSARTGDVYVEGLFSLSNESMQAFIEGRCTVNLLRPMRMDEDCDVYLSFMESGRIVFSERGHRYF